MSRAAGQNIGDHTARALSCLCGQAGGVVLEDAGPATSVRKWGEEKAVVSAQRLEVIQREEILDRKPSGPGLGY